MSVYKYLLKLFLHYKFYFYFLLSRIIKLKFKLEPEPGKSDSSRSETVVQSSDIREMNPTPILYLEQSLVHGRAFGPKRFLDKKWKIRWDNFSNAASKIFELFPNF